MPATLERTVTINRELAQRASRKLHRYGRTIDDVVAGALTVVVSMRGLPSFVEHESDDETPNAATRAAFMEAEEQIKDDNGWLPVDDFLAELHKECAR